MKECHQYYFKIFAFILPARSEDRATRLSAPARCGRSFASLAAEPYLRFIPVHHLRDEFNDMLKADSRRLSNFAEFYCPDFTATGCFGNLERHFSPSKSLKTKGVEGDLSPLTPLII
jgi:hypothetical protein